MRDVRLFRGVSQLKSTSVEQHTWAAWFICFITNPLNPNLVTVALPLRREHIKALEYGRCALLNPKTACTLNMVSVKLSVILF